MAFGGFFDRVEGLGMFRRLIVLVGVFVLLLGHSEAHAVLAPVKIYNVLSKVLKANAARAGIS